MAKGGKLSQVEKSDIQKALSEGKSVNAISKELNRSESVVQKYIDGELDHLVGVIAKVHAQHNLIQAQMQKLAKLKSENTELQEKAANPQSPKQPTVQDILTQDVSSTDKSRNVTVMTKAVSERLDAARDRPTPVTTKRNRGRIYDLKTQKVN